MKIVIDRKTFADALAEVAPFAPSKPALLILKYAKVTTKDNRMKIEANDTENAMVKYIKTNECDQDGSFLIDIAELNKFMQKVKGDTIELDVDDGVIKVKHSKGTAVFVTQNSDEFPAFKMNVDESTEISLPTSLLAGAIAKAKGFVSTDAIKPIMTAIYAYIKDGAFGYCATDTHKLINGHQSCEIPNRETDVHWLIMPPVFSALLTACKSADTAKIQITDANVQYTIGNVRIQTVQAKGNYPNFQRVIPQTWNMECAVDKSELIEAIGRVSLFVDSTECVKMNISRMDMSLTVDNIMYNKSANENITHNGCDGEITIGVNGNHLLSSIAVFNAGEILMRMSDPARPILFAQRENDGIRVCTMPMTIVNG